MTDAEFQIRKALDRVRVIDPHCHLRLAKPSADSIADIVLYHHIWIELVSAGMPQTEVTKTGLPHEISDVGMDPVDRVRKSLPWLNRTRNTITGVMLGWILKDLYGCDRLTEDNLAQVADRISEKGCDPAWEETLFRDICGIDASISVELQTEPCNNRMLKASEAFPVNLINGKQNSVEVLVGWEKIFGKEIRTASDYVEFLRLRLSCLPIDQLQFIGWWVLPYITPLGATEQEASRILRKASEGANLAPEDLGRFCFFGARVLLEILRETSIRTIQVIAGAEVLLPHRSITHWDGRFCGAIGRLANEFEDFRFDLSVASDIFTQDLCILARHLPNISLTAYWWHTLYPHIIKKSLELRLDAVPANKITAYFSDAYHAEWCYPKLRMVKEILRDILIERVERRWYDTGTAVEIIHQVFARTPAAVYGIHAQ
ncbi:MAG: hypothetical protein O2954_08435 [bacterium]|nr:hypothetical protein [bacterium]